MHSRFSMGIAIVLLMILAAGTQVATAWEPNRLDLGVIAAQQDLRSGLSTSMGLGPGRLAAFTAKQSLRDEVCIAMADGHISRVERYIILSDAKRILKPEEYEGFKRSLDRLSPPQPAKTAKKKSPLPVQREIAKKKSPPPAQPEMSKKQSPSFVQQEVAKVESPSFVQQEIAKEKLPFPAQQEALPLADPSLTLTIPVGVIMPDGMAIMSWAR